ncbi:MAG TPA: sulfite exporter TauE/SafE family protein [Candidatus Latescibacteria bacterium]|nr:sulfite exporter TauE/SafE family protein [Candidatus Latescibacterota bacterium]
MGTETILLASLIVFWAFIVLGMTGFGSGLIMVPLLLLFLDIKLVVPVSRVLGVLCVGYLTVRLWREIRRDLLLPVLVGSLFGTVLGTYVLASYDSTLLRKVFGGFVILFSVRMFFESRGVKSLKLGRRAGFLAGMISGWTASAFGTAGPPAVIYYNYTIRRKNVFRATLITYFFLGSIWGLVVYGWAGLITMEVIRFTLYLLPAFVAGAALGFRLHGQVNEALFRRVVAAVLLITAGFLIFL